jgi:acyl-CoA dehydrogenase
MTTLPDAGVGPTTVDLDRLRADCEAVVAPAARDVDREARFPSESLEVLRQHRLLVAAIPAEHGGMGLSTVELAGLSELLARHCASTGMIWAMHVIQAACIANHGVDEPVLADELREIADRQLLLASATSEVGIGGNLRRSNAAVERDGERTVLNKECSTISYGAAADAYLVTARRAPDAAPDDQVLVLVHRDDATLEPLGRWDTMGMRGTCSPGFRLSSTPRAEHVLPRPFGEIASQTMTPLSHILWAGVWTGIAADAVERARQFVRGKAKGQPEPPPVPSARLADAAADLQLMQGDVRETARAYDEVMAAGADVVSNVRFTMQLNNLKLNASRLAVDIAHRALEITGLAGYSESSPFSVARHLRDAHSASLMIANDRLRSTNSRILLVSRAG